jgi:nucleoside-diphosphate-sugar epimerase
MSKRILLTGCTGGIGRNVYHYLKNEGYDIIGCCRNIDKAKELNIDNVYEVDLTSRLAVKKMMSKLNPYYTIHLAAISSPSSVRTSKEFLTNNINATQYILENIEDRKIIYSSSVVVYGDQFDCNEDYKPKPTTLYGATKMASECLIHAAYKTYNVKHCILRMCATVGEGMTHGLIPDLQKKLKLPEATLFGRKPGSAKPYIHIDDVVRIIEKTLSPKFSRTTLNVCTEGILTVDQIRSLFDPENKCSITWDVSKVFKGDNKTIDCRNDKLLAFYNMKYPTSKDVIQAIVRQSNA